MVDAADNVGGRQDVGRLTQVRSSADRPGAFPLLADDHGCGWRASGEAVPADFWKRNLRVSRNKRRSGSTLGFFRSQARSKGPRLKNTLDRLARDCRGTSILETRNERDGSLGQESTKTLFQEIHRLCHVEGLYPLGWIERTECPCCGASRFQEAFKKLGIRHSRCAECDYVCVDPYPPPQVMEVLYSGDYYTRMREFYELPRLRDQGIGSAYSAPVELLDALIAKGTGGRESGAWLDVGGGLGAFASLVSRRAPGWNVSLNEMNVKSIEIARDLLKLDVLPEDSAVLRAEGREFDVVSSIAVLEHVVDPVAFVSDYAALLKPGGLLITVVPHFTRLNVHVSKASNSNVVPPFHLSLFGADNLERLLRRTELFSGFETMQGGGASFTLIDHAEHWMYWDSLLPDADHAEIRTVRTEEYPLPLNIVLNALSLAVPVTSEYFAATDGMAHLAICATRKNVTPFGK
ncbi:methyltransferase domain-containing protein [Aureimonas leprariae]|uniref:Methyltransferase domain-containing protein n=2 Tax=Plantimonas leprariae TaxID=2615207 RepID=A0A7V7PKB5_9HYPH|nr:methyltransferase domain-containing protein [Aureimonas leprariae]